MGQYVALLDILGFKDMINNNSHEEMVNLFENFRIYVQKSLAKHKTTTDRWGRLTYDVAGTKINSNIISDSLVFWTNDNKASDFFELVDCLHLFISFCHNLPKIFLRGGITYGDFYYDNTGIIRGKDALVIHPIMFGKALVDIYEIEKTLQISGCIITEKAIEEAAQNDKPFFDEKWKEFVDEKKVVQYQMPTKSQPITFWTINWVRDSTHPDLEEITNGFSSFNKNTDVTGIKEKIDNTIAYYSYIKDNVFKR